MNTKKIAFIVCVNDKEEFAEAEYYLNRLFLPEGFEKDIITVENAPSMTSGYNAGMKSSDAKYKVYLHQDVFIINQSFIFDLLELFGSNDKIGAFGSIGCDNLPLNGRAVSAWNVGQVYHNCIPSKMVRKQKENKEPMIVEAVDGLIIATQYDVRWREDLFEGWDFYDVSQCFEMKRAGYEVVVPWQKSPWFYHDCTYSKMTNYDKYCERLIAEYQDIKPFVQAEYRDDMREYDLLKEQTRLEMKKLVEKGEKNELRKIFEDTANRGYLHLREFELLSDIERTEAETETEAFWKVGDSFETILTRMRKLKFALKRVEYDADFNDEALKYVLENFSMQAVNTVFAAYISEKEKVKSKLTEFMKKS